MFRWAMRYQDIFKMPSEHRPADDVIEDDEELDKYMDALMRRLARQSGRAQPKGTAISLFDSDDLKDTLPTWAPGQ